MTAENNGINEANENNVADENNVSENNVGNEEVRNVEQPQRFDPQPRWVAPEAPVYTGLGYPASSYSAPTYSMPAYSTGAQQPLMQQPGRLFQAPPPPVAQAESHRKRWLGLSLGAAAALAAIAIGLGTASAGTQSVLGVGSEVSVSQDQTGGGTSGTTPNTWGGSSGTGTGGTGTGSTGAGTQTATSQGTATAEQSVGVVNIVTTLGYEDARAAGTGTIMTSDGEILTNNHVVDGATEITVTVVSTGKSYSAKVVGTAPTLDVAVLQLDNASGLQKAAYGSADDIAVGDTVVGVGNAGGKGGTPSSATGQVTALEQSITATDEGGANPENLTGLIETSAPIEAGDSGGPLYDANGEIIGMDTAAQTDTRTGATTAAYAIPIDHALDVAAQILSGVETDTIHIGYPAFLGVQMASSSTSTGTGRVPRSTTVPSNTAGAVIAGVVTGTPAAKIGLAAGDTITAVGSTSVATSTALSEALSSYEPGDSVKITWTDASGQSHSATVTLIQGAAD